MPFLPLIGLLFDVILLVRIDSLAFLQLFVWMCLGKTYNLCQTGIRVREGKEMGRDGEEVY